MEIPKYLQILWAYRWFLLIGLVLSLIAGLLFGFTIRGGAVVPRAEQTYQSSATILIDSGRSTLFQAEIPAPAGGDPTVATATQQDLASIALVYAYLAAGAEVQGRVEAKIGALAKNEDITAVSRTTQPAGDERFPGRLALPILDIVGVAATAERAELISTTANDEFQALIIERQNADDINDDIRVILTTLTEKPAVQGAGSNPAIPVVAVTGAGFLFFVIVTFIIYGLRSIRRPRGERSTRVSDAAADDDH